MMVMIIIEIVIIAMFLIDIFICLFFGFFNPITPNVYINRIQNKSMREDPLSFTLPDMDTAASFGIIPPQFSI